MPQDKYNKNFDVDSPESEKLKAAFQQVCDIRKFEIELYWKRATYFWALIAVAFAGYLAILSSEHMQHKYFLSMVAAAIGGVFTFAWFLANRGSKYWQENWENHLDLLEDNVTGPLYKTLLERPGFDSKIEEYITGPLSVSVSKINQWVSVFVIIIWILLFFFSACKSLIPTKIPICRYFVWVVHVLVLIVAVGCCRLMLLKGKTHKGPHTPNVRYRVTEIENEIK